MLPHALRHSFLLLIIACRVLLAAAFLADEPASTLAGAGQSPAGLNENMGNLRVSFQGPDGAPVDQLVLVILSSLDGRMAQQATGHSGLAEFIRLPQGVYNVEVVAPGYDRAVRSVRLSGIGMTFIIVTLKPASDGYQPRAASGGPILAPKAKKELAKAQEAIRIHKLGKAQPYLEAVYRRAPGNPEVNYVYGIYWIELNELAKAKSCMEKVLSFNAKHAGALRSMGVILLRESQPLDAAGYFKKAVEAEPTSWIPHALLADADLRLGLVDDAIMQAERAAELGHEPAEVVRPILARALAERGDKERAIHVLQSYLQNHASDRAAKEQLESLQVLPQVGSFSQFSATTPGDTSATVPVLATSTLFLPSSWLPPDVDEKVPLVEPGAPCSLDEVLKQVGTRVQEFVSNVDRFTATESITHETINKWGLASPPEKLKFDYLVSIEEIRHGVLNVEEFRSRADSQTEFPDGVERHGLPALLLIFHPYYAGNYEMMCEGLAHWSGGLAWQMHFRQRSDKPNTIYRYRFGADGPSYPVALKGRAWIAADSYQIVRLETDLVASLPEIRLVADHSSVEYAPVHFRERNVEMWLPQTAEFFYDWRGHRGHRIHRFLNYLLFSVDEKQHISAPKDRE